jgi:hypothetical protein
MLKRQRQSSPPPASSNIHLIQDLGAEERHAKRRRTQQPMLAEAVGQAVDDDDSCEEYRDSHATNAATHELTEMTNTLEEYKSANTMLRDLHILNQHRLMFSSPAPHSFSTTHLSSLNPTHQPPCPVSYMGYSTPTTKLHPIQTGKPSNPYSSRHKIAEQDQFQTSRFEEAGVVVENYENINKCVQQFHGLISCP